VTARDLDRLGRCQPLRHPDGRWMTDPAPDPCTNCGNTREGDRRGDYGLCLTCERRWKNHGYPAGGVPDPAPGRGGGGDRDGYLGRVEDYQILTRERGLSSAAAALALGLTRRTLQRYEAALRAGTA
jgi:hypothetical protein